MNRNSKLSDSDVTARKRDSGQELEGADQSQAAAPQTSTKSGKHSSVEKSSASRPEAGPAPGAKPKPGSFGSGQSNVEGFGGRPGEVSDKVRKTKGSTKEEI